MNMLGPLPLAMFGIAVIFAVESLLAVVVIAVVLAVDSFLEDCSVVLSCESVVVVKSGVVGGSAIVRFAVISAYINKNFERGGTEYEAHFLPPQHFAMTSIE